MGCLQSFNLRKNYAHYTATFLPFVVHCPFSPYWAIPIGLIFVWLGLNLMGIKACPLPSGGMSRIQMRGYSGALFLGLAYGILSGACTFGFIAPILAVITVQQKIMKGLVLIIAFALGHCLPIVIAGSSAALAQKILAA